MDEVQKCSDSECLTYIFDMQIEALRSIVTALILCQITLPNDREDSTVQIESLT
jgi:hypothetical protein